MPYEWLIKDEGTIKVAFLDFFNAMRNVKLAYERATANDRIDAAIETEQAVYIFEFKYDKSAQESFAQIVEKRYHAPYLGKGKPIYGIGLNFSPTGDSRGIDDPVAAEIGYANTPFRLRRCRRPRLSIGEPSFWARAFAYRLRQVVILDSTFSLVPRCV